MSIQNNTNSVAFSAARKGSVGSTAFSLFYHVCFLFVFLFLGVKPMFYFNIASVTIFGIALYLIIKTSHTVLPFMLQSIEVVAHQVTAVLLLGVNTSFHLLLIIIATSGFIIFRDKRKIAFVFSVIPIIAFIILEMLREVIVPVYEISPTAIHIIKFVNVTMAVSMIVLRVFEYAKNSFELEDNLEEKVTVLAHDMQKKNEEVIYLQNQTIYSLSNLVENRDNDTGMHIQRTSAYVKMIATEAKKAGLYPDELTDDAIALYEKAAPMHDIGKILIADNILKKPGKLTDEEFKEMQRHCLEGGRIVQEVLGTTTDKEYLKIASEIATCHHEKWNGKGYPKQLQQYEIPLSARIMAIADVFDALVSPRCYKEPFSVDKACSIIQEDAGSHFDPELARIFLENRAKAEEIMAKF